MSEILKQEQHQWNLAEKTRVIGVLAGALIGAPNLVLAGGALMIAGHVIH